MPYVPYHRQVPKKPYFVKEEAAPEAGPPKPPSIVCGVFWGLWLFILSALLLPLFLGLPALALLGLFAR